MSSDPLTLAAAEQARNVAVQMMVERGRGLVLVGAARLDLALEHLLKAVMAPSAEPDDKLFTPDRSLGSYGAKISIAARLGTGGSRDITADEQAFILLSEDLCASRHGAIQERLKSIRDRKPQAIDPPCNRTAS